MTLIIMAAVGTVFCTIIAKLDRRAGMLSAVMTVLLILIYLVSTRRRYKKIASLASEVNKLLHGDLSAAFDGYSEGELGILHSEIYKMTVRLREQQQRLISDKVYLADSIADISHQIRTPLTSISLMLGLISDPKTKDERKNQLLNELQIMISRIDWLITALLKISRLDAGTVEFKYEKITAEELVKKACAPLLIPIELHGQLLCINGGGSLKCDVSWTCEAIGNIVKNCMEHTPEGGSIEIVTAENPLYTEIVIKDSGSGISKEDMPHIFKRFYKGKNSDDKSFGVGLSLSRMIIMGQNGTVKAENQISSGAMFTVRFYKGTV